LQAEHFLVSLSNEVSARLQTAAARGRTITLKVKRRKEGEGEPVKFMGCGVCDSFSRSESVACATDTAEVLLQISRQLFNSFHLDVCEVRGVGLQVTKLESALAQPASCKTFSYCYLAVCTQIFSKFLLLYRVTAICFLTVQLLSG
jgi:nucleotidyltransferase/DNA polymerase involved in DNA repair